MDLVDIYKSMEGTVQKLTISELLQTNERSKKYGLILTANEASALIEARNQAIKSYGRVELGIGVVTQIISAFCNSPYICTQDYAFILNELIEIFYYMKNETEDKTGDEELICIMKDLFDNHCKGSLELLKNRELPLYIENFRQQLNKVTDLSWEEGEF